ncbi:hypothetical protein V8N79_004342 [Salmonella enterica]
MPYYNGRWHRYSEAERRDYGERKRQEQREAWHENWFSKTGLKDRFWTDKAIEEFLDKPRKAGPIMAWRRSDVIEAEKTPAFKEWMKKRCSTLVAHGKVSSDIFKIKLTPAQRDFLAFIANGGKVVKIEKKPGKITWNIGKKSYTRIARTLEDAGLISSIYQTTYVRGVTITLEGLSCHYINN